MKIVRAMEVRDNFKGICDMVVGGETVVVPRPHKKNVVLISEDEYNEMNKARRNAEYIAKIKQGFQDVKDGKGITKTMDELLAMEGE
jgi:antitoxin YefM